MSRIAETFEKLRKSGSAAYIPYVCAGDPSESFSMRLIERLCNAGADILELGLPFSDPMADGAVVQGAMMRSLSGGFRVNDIFRLISSVRDAGINQPIVLMTYYNPVLRFGVESFCHKLRESGADGILVVDLPIEESGELDAIALQTGLDVIRLVAPTTDNDRLNALLSNASGFVYAVSVAGTTGSREIIPESAISLIRRVVTNSEHPVVLGFGISSPRHVREAVDAGASGVVEGSRIISIYADHLGREEDALRKVESHAQEMKTATSMKR